jgi:hypothetical protein
MTFVALRLTTTATALLSIVLLAGCGGGGSSAPVMNSTPPPSSASFPIQQAMHKMYATGYQKNYTINGTASMSGQTYPISGALQIAETLVNANATFNGQAAIEDAMIGSGTITIENLPFNLGNFIHSNIYLDANNSVLGVTTPNSYCVNQSGSGYPTTAIIGQSGTVSFVACYTDSSKSTTMGSETISFAVTAGPSATTAVVTLTFTQTNAAGQQAFSYQASYSVDTSANITAQSLVYSIDINGVQVSFTAK